MVITKLLEGTLSAGQTTITFTDSDIPNSFIKIGCTNPDLFPTEQSITGNVLTIKYEAQSSSLGVVVELAKAGMEIIDNLTSDDTDKALSAKQGNVLKNLIPAIKSIGDIPDVIITSLTDGQILQFNGSEWVNVDTPSGGGGVNYSTSEQNTGIKWTDGKDIYQKSYEYTSISGGDNIFSFDLTSDCLVIDQKNTFINTSEKMYWSDNNVSGNSINLVNTNYDRTVINIASTLAPYLSKATITVKYTKGN